MPPRALEAFFEIPFTALFICMFNSFLPYIWRISKISSRYPVSVPYGTPPIPRSAGCLLDLDSLSACFFRRSSSRLISLFKSSSIFSVPVFFGFEMFFSLPWFPPAAAIRCAAVICWPGCFESKYASACAFLCEGFT